MSPTDTQSRHPSPRPRADIVRINLPRAPDPIEGLLGPAVADAPTPITGEGARRPENQRRPSSDGAPEAPGGVLQPNASPSAPPVGDATQFHKRKHARGAVATRLQKGVQFDADDIEAVEDQVKKLQRLKRRRLELPPGFEDGVNFSAVIRHLIRTGLPIEK